MSLPGDPRRQLTTPPYRLLPFAVCAFFVLCFALHPFSPFATHHLADPDDYMRLTQAGDWLRGQNWYDLSVPRLSPEAGTIVHWSRLVDLPIAAIAWPFIPVFGVTGATLLASMIVPLLWFAVLLGLLPALARPLIGADRATLACVLVLFAPLLLFNYTPGRVDHHGIQAIIAGFGLLSLGKIIRGEQGSLFAIAAAAAFSCGFWIGAEALPWAILFIACLGIAAARQNGKTARDAALFGLCLPLFTTLLIPCALPAAEFSSRALSWFSPAYAIFAALSGLILIAGWLAGRHSSSTLIRCACYALLGIIAAAAFFALIPSVLRGPFTDYDHFDATTALDNIMEAQPLWHALRFNRFMPMTFIPVVVTFMRLLALPLAATIFCLHSAKQTRDETRLLWLAQAFFLSAALAMTLFWQLRVGIFMEIFAIAPLTALLCKWCDELKGRLWDRPLFWAELGAFMLLGPLPVILLPALMTQASFYPDILLFPAARAAAACPLEPIRPYHADPKVLGAKPLTIMNTSDTGPQLLFATTHRVIAGNFDVPGNQDAYAFFHATDDAKAQAAARRWNADLVLICRTAPTLYLGADYYALQHTTLRPDKTGILRFTNTDPDQPLIERLIRGQTPSWLKPVEIPDPSDYLIFRIQYPAGKK